MQLINVAFGRNDHYVIRTIKSSRLSAPPSPSIERKALHFTTVRHYRKVLHITTVRHYRKVLHITTVRHYRKALHITTVRHYRKALHITTVRHYPKALHISTVRHYRNPLVSYRHDASKFKRTAHEDVRTLMKLPILSAQLCSIITNCSKQRSSESDMR